MGVENKKVGTNIDDRDNQQMKIGSDLYEPETYKQSLWSELIDVSQVASEVTNNQELAEWVEWMKEEGFRLSDKEVAEKMTEMGLGDE